MKKSINSMKLEISAVSANESFARGTVAAFAAQANPTLDEINDIKTAISEAVTNCVVHAYAKQGGAVHITCDLYTDALTVTISDCGIGIKDVGKALEPFYTTRPDEERSGMGFTVMQSFMDTLHVTSTLNQGTVVTMQKFFSKTKSKKVVGGE
jgi:stage II sporulation protein AB (anti-sigma F factor)